jgi:ferric-dicitrate binding protein FerR (iron transport regulator)
VQYLTNKEEVKARTRAWKKANPEKARAYKRAYYWANLEREREARASSSAAWRSSAKKVEMLAKLRQLATQFVEIINEQK